MATANRFTYTSDVELFIHDVAVDVLWVSCENSCRWNTCRNDEAFVPHGQNVFQTRYKHLNETVDVAVFRLGSQ